MEKPCCVDAPGFNMLMETNKLAEEKGLKVGVGFQRRHTPGYHRDASRRSTTARSASSSSSQAYWNGGGIWNPRPQSAGMTEMEYQVNNWYHFCWLTGDNICEQHVHNLDVCNWVMDDHPVEANGMGGCTARYTGRDPKKGMGQIFDHHFVEFTYKDGSKLYSQCRQIPNTWGQDGRAGLRHQGPSACRGGRRPRKAEVRQPLRCRNIST